MSVWEIPEPVTDTLRQQIVAFAAEHGIAVTYGARPEYVVDHVLDVFHLASQDGCLVYPQSPLWHLLQAMAGDDEKARALLAAFRQVFLWRGRAFEIEGEANPERFNIYTVPFFSDTTLTQRDEAVADFLVVQFAALGVKIDRDTALLMVERAVDSTFDFNDPVAGDGDGPLCEAWWALRGEQPGKEAEQILAALGTYFERPIRPVIEVRIRLV